MDHLKEAKRVLEGLIQVNDRTVCAHDNSLVLSTIAHALIALVEELRKQR